MGEIINPENELEEIHHEKLLRKVMLKKNEGLRLSQICCAYVEGKVELSYSFENDETYEYKTLRLVIDPETPIPSVTEFYPYAFLYENEMKELFGLDIRMINVDFDNKLYRINVEAPFAKKEGK